MVDQPPDHGYSVASARRRVFDADGRQPDFIARESFVRIGLRHTHKARLSRNDGPLAEQTPNGRSLSGAAEVWLFDP